MNGDSSAGKYLFMSVLLPTTSGIAAFLGFPINQLLGWALLILSLLSLLFGLAFICRYIINIINIRRVSR